MLTQICAEIKNYFTREEDKHTGDFEIINGQITPSLPILDGQYYRIIGSVFNDGVHISSDVLKDEPKFNGSVWLMRVPSDVEGIAREIAEWEISLAKNGVMDSPYSSESFGGYSYTMAGNADGKNGASWTNQSNFMAKLRQYRKVNTL